MESKGDIKDNDSEEFALWEKNIELFKKMNQNFDSLEQTNKAVFDSIEYHQKAILFLYQRIENIYYSIVGLVIIGFLAFQKSNILFIVKYLWNHIARDRQNIIIELLIVGVPTTLLGIFIGKYIDRKDK